MITVHTWKTRTPYLATLFCLFAACGGNSSADGSLGGACYADQTCDSPYVCNTESDVCEQEGNLGGLGEACYADQSCDSPYVCNTASDICEQEGSMGGLGEACYTDQTCDSPYVCNTTSDICEQEGSCEFSTTIFLNRQGGTYAKAFPDNSSTNTSSVVVSNNLIVAGYPFNQNSWSNLVAATAAIFAPYDVVVTDVDPGVAAHIEIVATGDSSSSVVGVGGVLSIAPVACGGAVNPIGFVFANENGDVAVELAALVALAVGNSQGLDFTNECGDLMSYDGGCRADGYTNQPLTCGTTSARDCACGGSTQNSQQTLMGIFGANPCD